VTVVVVDMEMDQDQRKALEIVKKCASPRLEWSDPHIHIRCRSACRGIESILEKINILSFLLANVVPLQALIRHQTEMDVGKMCPILSSGAEGFSMSDVRVPCLDALDFVLDEAVVGRGDSLPLLRRSVRRILRALQLVFMIGSLGRWHRVVVQGCLIYQQARRRA